MFRVDDVSMFSSKRSLNCSLQGCTSKNSVVAVINRVDTFLCVCVCVCVCVGAQARESVHVRARL